MTLSVAESGAREAPSIIFLHGVGTSGWMWWRQVAALADFHCLNVDLPGHGQSHRIPWVSLEDTTTQIAEIIQSRATDGQAHVLGLSLGGYVGLTLLEHHTHLVQRAVLSGVTAAPMPNRYLLKPQIWMMSIIKRRWFARWQAKQLPLTADEQVAFTDNLAAMSIQTYHRIMQEAVDFHLAPALESVETPTLVVAGGKESKIILQAVDVIAQRMPNAQGCIAPGVGHGWNIEATGLFNAMVRAWITGSPLPIELHATL